MMIQVCVRILTEITLTFLIILMICTQYDLQPNNIEMHDRKKYLRCIICNDEAVGYNFDRITCESCKGEPKN
jgi:hypothetical protein